MAKQTLISNIHKNCMGTISFNFIGANLRKEQDFITYPINKISDSIYFQSDKRWLNLDLSTNVLTISKKGNTSWDYMNYGHDAIEISQEQIETLLNAIRGTALSKSGSNGIMYVDNGEASKI